MLFGSHFPRRPGLLGGVVIAVLLLSQSASAKQWQYNRDVRPILSDYCFACHGFDKATREAGLRLDLREGALDAIDPGNPDDSELVRRILSDDPDEVMPPPKSAKQLSEAQKKILREWVEQGAEYQQHWAFIAPQKTEPPHLEGGTSADERPIDRFVRARLAEEGIPFSEQADPVTLIRRVSLDLVGLPPSIAEVDHFLAASERDPEAAYAELVDRLLSSPHHGERWGRWWLDQARYADSNGYSIDSPREIWKFRDWVVTALNRDLPFDQFTIEQLAGDLLPDASEDQKVATGFHRNTQINQEGGIDREQFRIDSVFDRVATTGSVWLGLSIGCAQCHDHKFDPIEQKEFYQLFAFFNNQDEPNLRVYGPDVDVPALTAEHAELKKKLGDLIQAAGESLAAWEKSLDDDQKNALSKELQKILAVEPDKRSADQKRTLYAAGPGANDQTFQQLAEHSTQIETQLAGGVNTMVMKERSTPRKTTIFIQGDFTRPSDEVTTGTPAVLHPLEPTTEQANRLDLAKWIVDRNNPLTARVIVNRVWQQYFGRGIVETENDFGLQGSLPTHPELLDYLAVDFMEGGWNLKELHRQIVMSKTYRQSSVLRPDLRERDPENYLLARQRRLRLDAELVRDVGLAVSGLLSHKIGGPPVYPPIPDGVMNQGQVNRSWQVSEGEDRFRRGLYTFVYRATPPPSLSVFDAPEGISTCTRRIRSNTPLQALTLMNDAGFFQFATALQEIIEEQGIETAFRRCTSRQPHPNEIAVLQNLDSLSAARVLLNLDETVTRE